MYLASSALLPLPNVPGVPFSISFCSQDFSHSLSLLVISSFHCCLVAWSCLFVTSWAAAHQASQFFTVSWSLFKLMFLKSVMPSNHLVLCRPLSSCLQSFPASESFPMGWLFASGGQSTGASGSAAVLSIYIQS